MELPLLSCLESVPDFRHLRGLRHPLWFILLLLITGAMCGYWGARPMATFAQQYGAELCRQIDRPVPRTMPSYSTFRRILNTLDFQLLANAFNQWAQLSLPDPDGQWLSVDGKSIKSSLSDYATSEQNFVMLVSFFSHQQGFVYASQVMENKQISEQQVVQQMLMTLQLQGAVVTADALHCQKKPWRVCSNKVSTMLCV